MELRKAPFGMATEFEWRHRVLIASLIYIATYSLYGIDRVNVLWAFFHWDTRDTVLYGRLAFGLSAVICAAGAGLWTWRQPIFLSPLSQRRALQMLRSPFQRDRIGMSAPPFASQASCW